MKKIVRLVVILAALVVVVFVFRVSYPWDQVVETEEEWQAKINEPYYVTAEEEADPTLLAEALFTQYLERGKEGKISTMRYQNSTVYSRLEDYKIKEIIDANAGIDGLDFQVNFDVKPTPSMALDPGWGPVNGIFDEKPGWVSHYNFVSFIRIEDGVYQVGSMNCGP